MAKQSQRATDCALPRLSTRRVGMLFWALFVLLHQPLHSFLKRLGGLGACCPVPVVLHNDSPQTLFCLPSSFHPIFRPRRLRSARMPKTSLRSSSTPATCEVASPTFSKRRRCPPCPQRRGALALVFAPPRAGSWHPAAEKEPLLKPIAALSSLLFFCGGDRVKMGEAGRLKNW